ncbi:MAG TPA: hypothetical protein VIG24_14675 [Acidimicrobiia bacterium]
MATAAYSAKLYRSGTSTAMTAEATTLVTGKTYRITNAAKRMLDPAVAVVVDDGGSPVSASDILSIDYLHGIVTFDPSYTVVGAITVDANYLPLTQIADVYSVDASTSVMALDNTIYEDTAVSRIAGLKDISGSFSAYDEGATAISALAEAGTVVYLTLLHTGSAATAHLRARVLIESDDSSVAVDGLVESSYSFVGASTKSVEGRDVSWSFDY